MEHLIFQNVHGTKDTFQTLSLVALFIDEWDNEACKGADEVG